MWAQSLGQKDSLEAGMATHSSILAWRIPWAEEPGGPQSTGSHRVGHDRSDLGHVCTCGTMENPLNSTVTTEEHLFCCCYPGKETYSL